MTDSTAEALRAATLLDYCVLDTPSERTFDAIVDAVTEAIGVPMASISLIDTQRQWFKARVGLDKSETPITESICAVAVRSGGETFVVNDTAADPRFRDYDCVTGAPHIRFYAGTPLTMRNGVRIGTLCVLDRTAHEHGLDPDEQALLEELARRTVAALELRRDLRARGLSAEASGIADAVWLNEAATALDRAAAALNQLGATVALAHLDEVIDQVQRLRDAALEQAAPAGTAIAA